jgi:ABC-type transport system involved in multi-copper enzyme maturation permease subunit
MLISLLKKELYIQARNWKMYAFGPLYIIALAIFAFGLVWYISTGSASYDPGHGRSIFLAFIIGFAILTCLIAPAFTFSSISLEKEHNTFSQLKLTWLKPYQIIMGKAGLAAIFILILLSASLPVTILMMPLGGITIIHLIKCYLVVSIAAFTFSMVGLMCSSIFKSPKNSGFTTYIVIGFFLFGTELIPLILTQILKMKIKNPEFRILEIMNPVRSVLNSLGAGMQYKIGDLSSWVIATAGFILLSLITLFLSIYRIRN